MGAQSSSRLCCRECAADANLRRSTEDSGKATITPVWDEGVPLYNAAAQYTDTAMHNREDTGEGFLAPPPMGDDQGFEYIPPNFDENEESGATSVEPSSQSAGKTAKKDKKDKAQSRQSESAIYVPHEPEGSPQDLGRRENSDKANAMEAMAEPAEAAPAAVTTTTAKPAEKVSLKAGEVYGHPGMSLQILLEDGWKDFVDEDLKQVNDHLMGGTEVFPISSRGALYMIYFADTSNITQINPSTQKTRQLRLASPGASRKAPKEGAPATPVESGDRDGPTLEKQAKGCCIVS